MNSITFLVTFALFALIARANPIEGEQPSPQEEQPQESEESSEVRNEAEAPSGESESDLVGEDTKIREKRLCPTGNEGSDGSGLRIITPGGGNGKQNGKQQKGGDKKQNNKSANKKAKPESGSTGGGADKKKPEKSQSKKSQPANKKTGGSKPEHGNLPDTHANSKKQPNNKHVSSKSDSSPKGHEKPKVE